MAEHQMIFFSCALLFFQILHSTKCEHLPALDHVVAMGLQKGKDIQSDESLINLSVIMTNMAAAEAKGPESMFNHLDKYMSSLLRHLAQDSRVRLLIISDATLIKPLRLRMKM